MSPGEAVAVAKSRGLTGLALTDHNGLWGLTEAAAAAKRLGVQFITGIEISTFYNGDDVHMLGFARRWVTAVLRPGLQATRIGCRRRLQAMVERCQAAGYGQISMEGIEARYAGMKDPGFVSFDVARELVKKHGLSVTEAHRLVVPGGAGYVPYGDWLMTPAQAVSLLHAAGGVAVLAHPGIRRRAGSEKSLWDLLDELVTVGLDGIEVRHPFHSIVLTAQLVQYARRHGLLMTAGSDWHGPSRFPANEAAFGRLGLTADEFAHFMDRL